MLVKDLFEKDINRPINGVVKVMQNDESSLQQELSEYVVTTELQKHFSTFFESYSRAIDTPNDDIGVWISGFFGSGKSHFMKMLSYLLENDVVAGMPAVEYFKGKIDDPMVEADMMRAVGIPTESILFNIDAVGGNYKEGDTAKTAVLRSFERVFYEHLGFFGEDLRLAKLEMHIDKLGKTQEFRDAFEQINGDSWIEARSGYDYLEDDIIAALAQTGIMSEQAATHWFDGTEDNAIAPDVFVREIAAYANAKAEENGGKFRLLFMADEVGQFIGEDVNLMLNLQTLVEQIGTECKGRVWVVVTSQEAIDEVAMVVGKDFSKIQGRFKTRLSLSSSSVDEVIKKRVLAKTDSAASVLKGEYEKVSAALKSHFAFEDSVSDLGAYASEQDFADSYPFVGYQFKILPNVMTEIRKHGISAKHMSTGERSMLSAFQESAQRIQDEDCTALVPFWRFFDTIAKDLEHGIVQVVDRCTKAAESGQGLQPQDVEVLKLLYLIRYINDVKPTANNIAILMVDKMDVDMVTLKERVKESLDRLVHENYVARQGDRYSFLTDDEQDIARAIRDTAIDSAEITDRVKSLVFDGIYTNTKLRCGANDFPFDRFVDDSACGKPTGGMKLNIITAAHDLGQAGDGDLAVKSAEQALVVLSEDAEYYDSIRNALKIRKYVRTQNVSQLDAGIQAIIGNKQKEAASLEREAKGMLEEALRDARCAVCGQMVNITAANAKQVIDQVLEKLAGAVFTKAGYIDAPASGEDDVLRILKGMEQRGLEGAGGANEQAAKEMLQYLKLQHDNHIPLTMDDIQRRYQSKPFGWRSIDVAAVMARLIFDQDARISFKGQPVDTNDRKVLEYLDGKKKDGAQVELRERIDAARMRKARETLREFDQSASVPEDEDGLVAAIIEALEKKQERCRALCKDEYGRQDVDYPYPDLTVIENGLTTIDSILANRTDANALVREFGKAQDDLLDFAEDMADIDDFFPNQQRLFDEGVKALHAYHEDGQYVAHDTEADNVASSLEEILRSDKPYGRIQDISALVKQLSSERAKVLAQCRNALLDKMKSVFSDLEAFASGRLSIGDAPESAAPAVKAVLGDSKQWLDSGEGKVHDTQAIKDIYALESLLNIWYDQQCDAIDAAIEAEAQKTAAVIAQVKTPEGKADSVAYVNIGKREGAGKVSTPKREKKLRRSELGRPKTLTSKEDVDAYVEDIRKQLLDALEGNDSIRLA